MLTLLHTRLPQTVRTALVAFTISGLTFPANTWAQTAPTEDTPPADAAPIPPALVWPKTIQADSASITLYQPDVEKWDGVSFTARMAVSVTKTGAQAPTFGVVWITAQANIDKEQGIVTLNNLQVTKANFPTAPKDADQILAALRAKIPAAPIHLPLAQVQANVEISGAIKKTAAVPVKNPVPKIIYSNQQSMLILVDGDPVLQPLTGTIYKRVINTQAIILQDPTGSTFYVTALNHWYSAPVKGQGPVPPPGNSQSQWTLLENPPDTLAAAEQAAMATKQVNPLLPEQGVTPPTTPPQIFVSSVPAELIQTQGVPNFIPIDGTNLLEVKNSDSALFLYLTTNQCYVLISGRWFTAPVFTGPWKFISGKDLPADFAKIPPDSSKHNVEASVPGTPEANEALIANSVPQTAAVNRNSAPLQVDYIPQANEPTFNPIAGTPLQYAVNTSTPVIRVDAKTYYACQNGIWFVSTSPVGPWTVADNVPAVIYTIPVSCPIHYVTYVRVYGSTPEVVYVGYTPGYMGVVVAPDGTVVYGTGYYYPPYIAGPVYVAQPTTYGYGASFAAGAATGFAFGFAAAAIWGACAHPAWGPYYGWGNTYNVNVNTTNVYNHWGTGTVNHSYGYSNGTAWSSRSTAGYNPYNGHYYQGQSGSFHNYQTGASGVGREGSSYNPANGATAYGKEGAVSNGHGEYAAGKGGTYNNPTTGISAGGVKTTEGNANTGAQHSGNTAYVHNSNTGNTTVEHNGNVYSDKNGNVYQHSDNGWQQQNKQGGWDNASRSQSQDMERQSYSQRMGNDRFQSERGGGYRGGGGGGFRR